MEVEMNDKLHPGVVGGFPRKILENDLKILEAKGKEYGDSWKRRGGGGTFMMLARKWDRFERYCGSSDEILKVVAQDQRDEGILDDIRDLRRYLILVLGEVNCNLDYCEGMVTPTLIKAWSGLEIQSEKKKWDIFEVHPLTCLEMWRSLMDIEIKGWVDGSIATF